MAQLPPKIPNVAANWPSFGHQRSPPPSSAAAFHAAAQPSWVDEFFDFSSAKRSAHRRSMSDSIAFLEAASLAGDGGCHDFDRLDEDQLMSMFSDGAMLPAPLPPSLSNPSTPTSDNNSSNEEKPPVSNITAEEAQSDCKAEASMSPAAGTPEATVDPKRVKRILANRQSAQRSRVRKLQYISELERSVTCLQTEVSALSPRVAFLDHQRSVLTIGNSALKQRIAALVQDKIFKDAHQDALRKEIERLRQVYQQQSLRKMESDAASVAASEADGYCAEEELRI